MRPIVAPLLLLNVVVLLGVAAVAQKQLAGKELVVSSELNRPIYNPVRCDAKGNIYARIYAPGQVEPVLRVDPRGQTTKLSFAQDTDLRDATAYDFAVNADGEVFQAPYADGVGYLVRYSADGAYRGKTKLEGRFWVAHLAPLAPRNFLVTGSEITGEGTADPPSNPPQRPVTLIMNDSGQVVRDLVLPGDIVKEVAATPLRSQRGAPTEAARKQGENTPEVKASESKNGTDSDSDTDMAMLPLLLGDIRDGGDGYAYLLRRGSPALVYVISPSGRVRRTLKLPSPRPELMVSSMHVAAGRLALMFRQAAQKPDGEPERIPAMVVLFDASTGEKIAEYQETRKTGGTFACYQPPDRFAFITSSQGKLAIRWAEPE